MTSAHLIQWMQHPETLNRESLYELRTLINRYPYFHSLRLLYLKNLYLLHDASFGDELRKSALFVADRSVLFYHIEGERYTLHPLQRSSNSSQEAEMEEESDRTLFLIDSFLQTAPDEQPQHADLDYAMDYMAYLMAAEPDKESQSEPDDVPRFRGQNLIDDFLSKSETLPASECPLTDAIPEYDLAAIGQEEDHGSSVEEAGEKQTDSAQAEVEEETDAPVDILVEDETFTETLAKIYVKQHRYDKALEIIKKLSLNYPKKNAYFADQIRFLEKLIINAKSK